MSDPQKLTETGIENFRIFIKYLIDNDLFDDAMDYLKNKGHKSIYISIEPIIEIQKMIKEKAERSKTIDPETERVIKSGHKYIKPPPPPKPIPSLPDK